MPVISSTVLSPQAARDWATAPESMLVKDVWQGDMDPPTLSEGGKLPPSSSVEDDLHNNKSALKVKTAEIAMHLSSGNRSKIFSSIDYLLDPEDFDVDEDSLINIASFATYLRFLTYRRGAKPAALGVDHNGSLLGMWIARTPSGKKRLNLEFLPKDQIRCSYSCVEDGKVEEAVSYVGPVQRVDSILEPFNIQEMYRDVAVKP